MREVINQLAFCVLAVVLIPVSVLVAALLIARAVKVGSRHIAKPMQIAVSKHPAFRQPKEDNFINYLHSSRVSDALQRATSVMPAPASATEADTRPDEVAVSDCCNYGLEVRVNPATRPGIFCSNCQYRCLEVIYPADQVPMPRAFPFCCNVCNPHSLPQRNAQCICPRDCGSTLCAKLTDAGYGTPGYQSILPGRFA